jgi:hypothetical protein
VQNALNTDARVVSVTIAEDDTLSATYAAD